jgi:hypothetical protein
VIVPSAKVRHIDVAFHQGTSAPGSRVKKCSQILDLGMNWFTSNKIWPPNAVLSQSSSRPPTAVCSRPISLVFLNGIKRPSKPIYTLNERQLFRLGPSQSLKWLTHLNGQQSI